MHKNEPGQTGFAPSLAQSRSRVFQAGLPVSRIPPGQLSRLKPRLKSSDNANEINRAYVLAPKTERFADDFAGWKTGPHDVPHPARKT